jgi:thioesterase DpgC
MIDSVTPASRLPSLVAGGLDEAAATDFVHALDACAVSEANVPRTLPEASRRRLDTENLRLACRRGRGLLAALPSRSQRVGAAKQAGHVITHLLADASWRFFRLYAAVLYRELTDDGKLSPRVDALLEAAAARLPDVLPTEAELAAERELMQQDKDGLEIAQGLFVSQVCADRQCGITCCGRCCARCRARSSGSRSSSVTAA